MLLFLHQRLAVIILVYAFFALIWAILGLVRGRPDWTPVLFLFVLVAVQVLLGVSQLIAGARPATWLHVVYGVLALLASPFLYSYAGRHTVAPLWPLLATLLTGALALRAFTTGN